MWVHDSLNNRFHRFVVIQRSLGRLIRVQLKAISNITSHQRPSIVDPSKMWLNLKIIILEWTHEEYIPSPSLTTTMSLCRRLSMSLKNDDDSFFGIFMTKTPLKISLPHQISVRSSRVFISSNYQSSSSTTSREDNGSRLPNCKVVLPKSAKEAKQHQQHQDPCLRPPLLDSA